MSLANSCVDTIRVLSADMVEKANSGHPGAPMGCAPIAHVLYSDVMNYNPKDPKWANRDRFVLSNGHSCALLYSMLHLTGYDLTIEDLKNFRQFGSRTPGHPENVLTAGVEVSTGPLGQGLTNAVGMAMAEKHLAAVFNTPDFQNIVDHHTFVLCGDGCLQEGVTSEASSLAGHLGLGKLIVCYDDNHITIDGDTDLSFTEDVLKRYESYGWHVQTVADVNDLDAVRTAILNAKAESSKPSIIKIRTVIGHGSSKEGSHGVHGAPLGSTDLKAVKAKFGFNPEESFAVPSAVQAHYNQSVARASAAQIQWEQMFQLYAAQHPKLASDFQRRMRGELPPDEEWVDKLPGNPAEGKAMATRAHSGEVLNALAEALPELVGGSADLAGSNCTNLKCCPKGFQKDNAASRYFHFGVREHAMAGICNGMFAHGGVRPFCATFLNFIGYALGSVRVSALSNMGIIYVMTHDSIGLGEDGPTHQPIEMLDSLRAMPNLNVFRPADRNETKAAYILGMKLQQTPTVISLSRQGTPYIAGSSVEKTAMGGYVVQEHISEGSALPYPTLVLIGTGTELALALKVAQKIYETSTAAGNSVWLRVVSMPCMDLFEEQTLDYKFTILPRGAPVMSIEAASSDAWRRYVHAPFGINNAFGLSAPAEKIYEHFGFGVDNLTARANEVIAFYTPLGEKHPMAHSVMDRPAWPTIAAPHHA
eukprot:CAMPEP_0170369910 /NCGR_PEP_ID=MMETSP0117_2-20130122/8233_1 /TAXON_ID=400756 /ORGANISM="Durinskia baltica, Strain CSIRO CS-38" /LENGTH=703 /DNA_ID=CAMNT_0010624657 /DNA_START=46 /DNA_END=2157 /DNA_ORIENTATION=-